MIGPTRVALEVTRKETAAEPGEIAARHCERCGRPLSRYNPDLHCGSCASVTVTAGTPCPVIDLGTRVAELRRGRSLTQESLAERAGLCVSTIAKTERGAMTPRIGTLCLIAGALGVGMADLFSDVSPATEVSECTGKDI